jgi:TPR repeat protein
MRRRTLIPSLVFVLLLTPLLLARPASDGGDNRLASILRLPVLTPADWQELFSEADAGNVQAQYWLGRIYDLGLLLPKDPGKSLYWYQKSAEQNYAPAKYSLCLHRSRREPAELELCTWRGAEDGVPEAQFWLGVAFEDHWFGVTDTQEALKWTKRAAEGGNPDAEVTLGEHYEDGDGVEQNYALAAQWYRKAAEHVPDLGGAGQGRNQLGLLYLSGLGVPKDYVQAYVWFSLAASRRNLAAAAKGMTPAEILRAQQLAEDWKQQQQNPAIY